VANGKKWKPSGVLEERRRPRKENGIKVREVLERTEPPGKGKKMQPKKKKNKLLFGNNSRKQRSQEKNLLEEKWKPPTAEKNSVGLAREQ